MAKIIWSPLAQETYLETIGFILRRWSVKTANNFIDKVDSLLGKLKTFKHLCPASENAPDLRRCVITKQTSLIYEVNDDIIEIVAFFDNRSKKN